MCCITCWFSPFFYSADFVQLRFLSEILTSFLHIFENTSFLVYHTNDTCSKTPGNKINGYLKIIFQTSIIKDGLPAQKDHNSNKIIVIGAAPCIASLSKISLLLWSFSTCCTILKIDIREKPKAQVNGMLMKLTPSLFS